MDLSRLLLAIAIMAAVTYLPRALPIAVFRKRIKNKYIRSFLVYMPYGILAAMVFPEVFYSTGSFLSACVGVAVSLLLSYFRRGLLTVAVAGCAAVFLTGQLLSLLG